LKFKSAAALILAVVVAAAIAACGGSSTSTGGGTTSTGGSGSGGHSFKGTIKIMTLAIVGSPVATYPERRAGCGRCDQ
jgi:ABC-type glycerol-3-phosphate transport system substrate-binding protein